MTRLLLTTLGLLLSLTVSTFAQSGKDNNSRYGRGKDSIDCLLNVGMSREYVRKKEYKKAYLPWKEAITSCPKSQASLYSDGVKILHALLETEKDSARHSVYLKDLTDLYDKNILYKDDLNQFMQSDIHKDYLLATKAYDYLQYAGPSLDLKLAYRYVLDAVESIGDEPACFLFLTWMEVNLRIYQADPGFKQTFIEDYRHALSLIRECYHTANAQTRKMWEETLSRINDTLRKSGLENHESIQTENHVSYNQVIP